MVIQRRSELFQKLYITPSLLIVRWIFIIDVQTIQAIVLQQLDRRLHKLGSERRRYNNRMERRRVRPPSDTEQYFQVPILLFEIIDGFEVSIQIVAAVVPGVAGVMDVLVSPWVGEEYLSRISFEVCERIQEVTVLKCMSTPSGERASRSRTYVRSLVGIKDGGNFRP
jgi:hypothetical protein